MEIIDDNTFNVGNARIIDAGNTAGGENDVATKKYVDFWFDPIESREHYIKYIQARFFLMHPISHLCKVSSDINVYGGHIYTILGSNPRAQSFFFKGQGV